MRPERVEGLSTSPGDIVSTPVPAIQRRLAAVPDVRPRKAGFPPPPKVTLPVVAREVATSRTVAAQTPTPPPSAPPLSGPVTLSTAQPGPATDLETNSLLAEAEPITVLPGLESPTPQLAAEAEPLAYDETLPASDDLARGPETVRPGGQPTVQQSMVGHTPPLVQRTSADRSGSVAQFGSGPAIMQPSLDDKAAPPTPPIASPAKPVRTTDGDVEPVGPTAPLSGFAAQIAALADDHRPAELLGGGPSAGSMYTEPSASSQPPVPALPGPDLVTAPLQRHTVVGLPLVQRSADPKVPPTPTVSLLADRPSALSARTDLSSATEPAPPIQQVSFAPVAQLAGQPPAVPVVSRMAEPIRIASPPGQPEAKPTPVSPRAPASGPPPMATPAALPMPMSSPPPGSVPMVQRSFAAMFAQSDTAAGGPSRPDDGPGFTSVQLQPTADPAPAPTPEPTPTAAPPPEAGPAPTPAAAAPTAGAAGADLDEMARRLFEPLSARLRAELWLDRERAGLVTDARH